MRAAAAAISGLPKHNLLGSEPTQKCANLSIVRGSGCENSICTNLHPCTAKIAITVSERPPNVNRNWLDASNIEQFICNDSMPCLVNGCSANITHTYRARRRNIDGKV